MSMNLRHAAALALVGWYLIGPPVRQPKNAEIYLDDRADYPDWKVLGVFPDYDKCEFFRAGVKQLFEQEIAEGRKKTNAWHEQQIDAECVASDDPRIKGIIIKHPPN
jgi:hypothetical protein